MLSGKSKSIQVEPVEAPTPENPDTVPDRREIETELAPAALTREGDSVTITETITL